MPSSLASCLAGGFILWLFLSNRKASEGVSKALWTPVIWVWILASKPLAYWFGASQHDETSPYVDGSPIDRMVLLILIGSGLWILFRRRVNWRLVLRQNRWLIAFYVFCGLSVLWAPDSFVAFKRWVKEIGNLIMILVVLTEKDTQKAVRQIFIRCAYLLVPLSILVMKYYVDYGMRWNPWTGEASLCGVTNNKNTLGRLAYVSALGLLWGIVDTNQLLGWRKKIRTALPEFLVFVMCVWLLLKAESATSLACLLLGLVVFFGVRVQWVKSHSRLVGWLAFGMILTSLIVLMSPGLRGSVASALGRDVTLTDRTIIWDRSLDLGTNPLIGVGFNSVWSVPGASDIQNDLHAAHSHNGYLETYLNGGLIGLALLMAALLSAGRNCLRHLSEATTTGAFYAALFMSGVFYSYTEVGYNNMTLVGFAVWLVAMDCPSRARKRETSSKAFTDPVGEQPPNAEWMGAWRLSKRW